MNRRRLLAIGALATVLGAVTSWYVYRSLRAKAVPGTDVVVAARNIQIGDRIEAGDLRLVNYPSEFLPPDAFRQKERAIGNFAVVPISKGDFVLPTKISETPGDRLATKIPVGMRAVLVAVTELELSSMKPGDKVDVLVTGNVSASHDSQTRTVLTDLRLVETGPRSVILLASPEDSERLTLASHEGPIKLVLRNPRDLNQATPAAVTRSSLFGATESPKRKQKPVTVVPAEVPKYFDIQVIHGDHPPETIKLKE